MLSEAETLRVANQLEQFGCKTREARIYLKSLQLGPSSIQELAKSLGFNRVTVHSAAEQLLAKGLMFETRQGKKRLIAAEPPDVFSQILQKRENELKLMRDSLDQLTKTLLPLQVADASIPTVKFYEGVEGFKKMLEETLTTKGEVLVFTYVDLFSRILGPDYLEDYFRRRSAKGIHTRLIFPPCKFAERVNKRRERYKIQVRLLPENLKWRSGIFAWNDAIAAMSFTEGKITCTILENGDIADFWRNIVFELVWQQAKPM